jgi:hypothetical protein
MFVGIGMAGVAQEEDLLKSIEPKPAKEYVTNAFKSTRVINGQSMEFLGKGVLDFRILHRFGEVSEGISDMFGLDQASMRIGLDYGLGKNLSIGFGRSTLNKELDGFVKYRLFQQSKGPGSFPLSVVLVAGTTLVTLKPSNAAKEDDVKSRMSYYYQLILGRKFTNKFSLQFTPTLLHRNLVAANDENDIYAVGVGTRYKISKRVAFVVDYFYLVNGLPAEENENPLSVGFDIETGFHVFQLHFSNAVGMNERAFLTETTGKWSKGEIRFGFNLSRVFTLSRHHNKTSL